MKTPPNNLEFVRFTEAMRKIMRVPKHKIVLHQNKAEKQKPTSSASRVPVVESK